MARRFKTFKSAVGGRQLPTEPAGTPTSVSTGTVPNDNTPFCTFTAPYVGVVSNLRISTTGLTTSFIPGIVIETGAITVTATLPTLTEAAPSSAIPNQYTMAQDDTMSLVYGGTAVTGVTVSLSFDFTRAG